MRLRQMLIAASVAAAIPGISRWGIAQEFQAPGLPAGEADAEELLQGPIHEAFARPIQVAPDPGVVVPHQPPELIQEIPPEVKPAEEDTIWIPGYWSWDADRNDFVWISGVWRAPPPDQRWVPGYWAQVDGGFQWLSGFWAPMEVAEIEYLPYPPESIEEGPTSPQPSEEYVWVSGCWIYQQDGYAWRPGYWSPYYEDWVWVPAHYVWTPSGAIFVDGYWDYPVMRRGQLFAPVYFREVAHVHRTFVYSPRVAINPAYLLIHMFVNPRMNHYFCGDYYDERYRDRGYYAWSDFYSRPRYYDPLFAYYSTYYQTRGVDYTERLRGWHTYYQRHAEFRPPQTLRQQIQLAARASDNSYVQYSLLGQQVDRLLQGENAQRRYERVAERQREMLAESRNELRNLIAARTRIETAADNLRSRPGQSDVEPRERAALTLPDTPSLARRRSAEGDRSRQDRAGDRPARGPDGQPETAERPPRGGERQADNPPPRPDREAKREADPRRQAGRQFEEGRKQPGERPDGPPREKRPTERAARPEDRPERGRGPRGEETPKPRPGAESGEARKALRPEVPQPGEDRDSARPGMTPGARPGETRKSERPDLPPSLEDRVRPTPGARPGETRQSPRPDVPPSLEDRGRSSPDMRPGEARKALRPELPPAADERNRLTPDTQRGPQRPSVRPEDRSNVPPNLRGRERNTPPGLNPNDLRRTPSTRGPERLPDRGLPPSARSGRDAIEGRDRLPSGPDRATPGRPLRTPESAPDRSRGPLDRPPQSSDDLRTRGYRPEMSLPGRSQTPESRPGQQRPDPRSGLSPRNPLGGSSPRSESTAPDRGRSNRPDISGPGSRSPQINRPSPRSESPSAGRGRGSGPSSESRGSGRPDKPPKERNGKDKD